MSYGDLARAASTQGKVLERQGLANQRLSKVHASSYFNGVLKLGKISSTRIPAQCFFFFFFFFDPVYCARGRYPKLHNRAIRGVCLRPAAV